MNQDKRQKYLYWIAGMLGIYLISAGISWAIFSIVAGGQTDASPEGLEAARARAAELPKTEECPVNGLLYSTAEREIWESRRPLLVMVENNADARPLEGLSRADVVYESTVEGGITRNMAVFYCDAASDDIRIAPVRSARVNFVKWAGGYGDRPLYTHTGGANNSCTKVEECPNHPFKEPGKIDPRVDAISMLNDLGWNRGQSGNTFNIFFNTSFPLGMRDPNRLPGVQNLAHEHQVVVNSDIAYAEAVRRGFGFVASDGVAWDSTFRSWKFVDDSPSPGPEARVISFGFWQGTPLYDVTWEYDEVNNQYLRSNGGKEAVDLSNDNVRVTAKNVVVIFVDQEVFVDEELHNYDEVYGRGEAIVFQNGNVIEGTWEKEGFEDRLLFFDKNGEEVPIVRGKVWIEALPTGSDVVYN